jgi:hypothetical protein
MQYKSECDTRWQPHEVFCVRCGSKTVTKGMRSLCQECKDDDTTRHTGKRIERYATETNYFVVSDPGEFGYKKGAFFSVQDVKDMLEAQSQGFNIGTIIRRGRKFYRVTQDPTGKQSLKNCGYFA